MIQDRGEEDGHDISDIESATGVSLFEVIMCDKVTDNDYQDLSHQIHFGIISRGAALIRLKMERI